MMVILPLRNLLPKAIVHSRPGRIIVDDDKLKNQLTALNSALLQGCFKSVNCQIKLMNQNIYYLLFSVCSMLILLNDFLMFEFQGKCKCCGKAFASKLGFSGGKEVVGISCSWCKYSYHNKNACAKACDNDDTCDLGIHSKVRRYYSCRL